MSSPDFATFRNTSILTVLTARNCVSVKSGLLKPQPVVRSNHVPLLDAVAAASVRTS